METVMKKFKILTSLVVALSIVIPSMNFTFAENSNVLFDGNVYKISIVDGVYKIYDKELNKEIELKTSDERISEIVFDNDESVSISPKQNNARSVRRIGVPIPKGVNPAKLTYHRLDTTYSNTQQINNYKAFWMALVGFIPYIGQAVSVISFIDTVRSMNNNKIVYFKTVRYYADGFMYYKYVTSAYKDSARKKLIKKRTDYIKMF